MNTHDDHPKQADHSPASHTVVQRLATKDATFMNGDVHLYRPSHPTTTAVLYCHGVFHKMIPPIPGVTLAYVAPHQTTTSANPSAISVTATHAAADGQGQWWSYTLTRESNVEEAQLLELAEASQRAIAHVQNLTNTAAVVSALKDSGYSTIVAVHCREVLGEVNEDWDAATNQQMDTTQEGWLIDRSSMDNWLDASLSPIGPTTVINAGETFMNPANNTAYTVMVADENGRVRIRGLSHD